MGASRTKQEATYLEGQKLKIFKLQHTKIRKVTCKVLKKISSQSQR